uniref:Ribonuclease H-like domain-containing protein n=1 Tax=Tanacetum cinerariifolium TaxID=118510 RepID=A0A6L2M867_TANCI|nr:ribonuclease H-like domain-containing protein [Tanacetum cinerariifolium]
MVPTTVLTQSKPVFITAVRPVSTDVPKISVTRPRHAKIVVIKINSPTRQHINRNPSLKVSNSPPRVTAVKASLVNAAQGIQGKWEWKPKYQILDHVSHNTSALMTLKRFDYNNALGRSKSVMAWGTCHIYLILRSSIVDMLPLVETQRVMCDKNNSILFTNTECLVLSPEFKLPAANQVLLRVPREKNIYNVNLKNIVPSGDLTCLFAKATIDESNLWHRRLCHINFKTMNKLVKGNLVRGLPTKVFENDHTCVACKKGKQHRASYKTKPISSVDQPQYRIHMDLFRPTSVKSLNKKSYYLVVINDYSRVLVTTPHNKTPYELLHGRTLSIGFMRHFGCPVTILNTLDSLGKFDGKVDEGFLVGYSVSSKAFRLFYSRTRIVQETLPVHFLENKPNVTGSGPTWLFDIHTLTKTMNYQQLTAGNQSNPSAGFQDTYDAEKAEEEINQQYVLFLVWSFGSTNPQNTDGGATFNEKEPEFDKKKPESKVNVSPSNSAQSKKHDDKTKREAKDKSLVESLIGYRKLSVEFEDYSDNSINEVNAVGTLVPAVGPTHGKSSCIDTSQLPDDPNMPELEAITYSDDEDDVGANADFNNLETSITISPIPTTRVHKDHPVTQIIGDLSLATQTRSMTRVAKDQGGLSQMFNDDFYTCMFACFLSQEEPKRVHQDLKDPSWIEAMQEELLQFKMQKVWVLVDLPYGKRAIASKWVFKNKKDERGIVEEVYVCQPPGFEDPNYPDKVYKVVKALYGLQVKQKKDGIFISHDKYVAKILRNFGLRDTKSASTPIGTEKPLLKDLDGEDVDVHTYRSMIASLIYLTSSRPDIIFAFWTTVTVKKVNDVTKLQALVGKKKVVVKEDTIRDALCLDDAECLLNEEIFAELARVGYEKPSTKLTFYKAFFSSQWKKQVGDLSTHTTKYTSPTLTHKVFANMRRVGKGFSRVETPLFEGMVVAQEVGKGVADEVHDEGVPAVALARRVEHLELDKIAQALEITKLKRRVMKLERRNKVKVLKLRRLQKVGTAQRIDTSDDTVIDDVSNQERMIADMDVDANGRIAESQAEIYKINLDHANKVLSMHEEESEPAELQEVVDIVTTAKIITEVVTATSKTITAVDVSIPAATTADALTLTAAPSKGILVEEPKPLKKQAQIEQDEKYAKELEAELNKTIVWDKVIDHVTKKAKEDKSVKRYQAMKWKPQTEAQARKNMMVYLKNIDEEESRALKRINETPTEKAAKRQKLDEEVEELKRHLQIVPNEDDDVYIEATPLARKVPVVYYEIYNENNKAYFKIKRDNARYTCLNLEESKKCSWSSKSQELEAVRILWCIDNHIYNNTADFVGREETSGVHVHVETNGLNNVATWTAEYEKLNPDVPALGMIVDVVDSSLGSLITTHFLLLLGAAATLVGAAVSVTAGT